MIIVIVTTIVIIITVITIHHPSGTSGGRGVQGDVLGPLGHCAPTILGAVRDGIVGDGNRCLVVDVD